MEKDWFLKWDNVIYEPGVLCAVGFRGGRETERKEVRTAGSAVRMELVPYEEEIRADGQDTAIFQVRLLDKDGQLAVTAGRFLGAGNGDPESHEPDKLPVRRAFHGLCQLLVRTAGEAGEICVTAKAEGAGTAQCRIRCEK